MGVFRAIGQNLAALALPARCLVCEAPLHPSKPYPLCEKHSAEIVPARPPFCSKCGRSIFGETVEQPLCYQCRSSEVFYDEGCSACGFVEPLRRLVHFYKYGRRRCLRAYLGSLVLASVKDRLGPRHYNAVVPVPLHWARFIWRSFNQATELAEPLAKHLGIPIMKMNLRRARHTRPQVRLLPDQREANIEGAFKVVSPAKVKGRRLLLLDDIITTGSTMNECARVLKEAGAAHVTIVTLAHPCEVLSASRGM